MDKGTIGSRLNRALAVAGLSGRQLAIRLGVSTSIISKVRNDQQGSTTYLPDIAEIVGVRLAWLARGKGPMTDDDDVDTIAAQSQNTDVMLYRWMDARCSHGPNFGNKEGELPQVAIPASVFQRQKLAISDCFGDTAIDDAMADGVRIGDDLCISATERNPRDADPESVFAIRYADRLIYRHVLVSVLGDMTLECSNPNKRAYPDQHVPADRTGEIQIVGRMAWRGGDS